MSVPKLPSVLALPEGDAELHLVVRMTWQDLAALGQHAGRIAARTGRPVGLQEAATDLLRLSSAVLGEPSRHAIGRFPAPPAEGRRRGGDI
ncbi:hypothetical protein ABZ471_38140 [Streptomyces sp. NPDC005728]|uniref:hypothetical protein n=1 Tax=Streptomyces sp. NPDC005728 TaxID=3157054 RepID=UPI0033DD509E